MIKKISELTAEDKAEFLKKTKQAFIREQGIPWEIVEAKMIEELENTFDDEKFVKMNPDAQIDAAYARKAFGNKKPELVDYMLWMAWSILLCRYDPGCCF